MKKSFKNLLFFVLITCCASTGQAMKRKKPRSPQSRLFEKNIDFFQKTVVVPEKTFADWRYGKRKRFYEQNLANNAGWYHEYTVQDLKIQTQFKKPLDQKGRFRVLYDTTVQELFSDPRNHEAAFQSATTFYGLEGGMWNKKSYLINMQKCAVQGETVAACMLLGNIFRKYIYRKRPINYLKKIDGFKFKPGKISWFPDDSNLDYDLIKIGYQKDTAIVYEANPFRKRQVHDLTVPLLRPKKNWKMKGDQVISFAINFGKNKAWRWDIPQIPIIAENILKATYEAAIRAAFLHGRKKLYLTLVGLGAFENKPEWVYDAIKRMIPFIKEKNMKVYLVIPKPKRHADSRWARLEQFYNNLP